MRAGLVIGEQRHKAIAADGGGGDAYRKFLSETPRRQLPNIRRLMKDRRSSARSSFEHNIEIVVHGIAAVNNVAWQPVIHPNRVSVTGRRQSPKSE